MGQMITDLSEFTDETPHYKYHKMRNMMDNIHNDFKQIRNTMDKTFSIMSPFSGGWLKYSNCNIIKREFLMFNGGVCYDFKPATYLFYFFLMIGNSILSYPIKIS